MEGKVIDFMTIIAIQILLMVVGYFIASLLGVKKKLEALGLSYLLGSGLITILFLINHFLFKLDLGAINFLLSAVGSVLALIFISIKLKRKNDLFNFKFNKFLQILKELSCIEKFILIFILLLVGYTMLENYVWPITDWDALALYDFRARVMAITGNMREGVELGYFFQYPPFTSFLHVFGYIFGTERVKIVYSFLYTSLLIIFYSLLKRKQNRLISLVGTLLLAVDTFIFNHSIMAYTNLAYVVFISIGLVYLIFWLEKFNRTDLMVGAILVALSTWVRASDPFWYLGILIIIFGLIKSKKNIKIGMVLIIFTIILYKFWDSYVSTVNIISQNSSRESVYLQVLLTNSDHLSSLIKSIPEILVYFWQNVINVINYLLPLGIFTFFYDLRNKNLINIYIYLTLMISLFLILIGIFIFSLYYQTWNMIGDSLQRMSMVLIPLIVFAIFNSSIWKEKIFESKK